MAFQLISKLITRKRDAPGRQIRREPWPPSPFIVGVGRSGTTLLRLMLDAHPELAIPPETHFIPSAAVHKQASNPHLTFLETLTSHHMWGDHCIDGELFKQRIVDLKPFDLSEALRTFYRLYAERFGKPRWGDKTPLYLLHMRLIHSLLPEARFVHLIRDGRDVALSHQGLWFGPKSIEEAARWWTKWITDARHQAEGLPYLEVRYEDLLLDATTTLKKICAFIELSWNPEMLNYYETAEQRLNEMYRDMLTADGQRMIRADERKSIHSLTSKPPQHNRIGRWRTEMTLPMRARFEEIAGGMLQELGYEIL